MPWRKLLTGVVLSLSSAWGQGAPTPSFEVASVKLAAPCCAPGQWPDNRPGADRVNFRYVTLWYCLTYAYGVKSYQLFGPDWLKGTRYDILAKGGEGTSREQLPKMMQALLEDRFGMQVHRETREIPGLALTADTTRLKLRQSAPESGDGKGGARIGVSISSEGVQRLDISGAPMTTVINTLSALLGRPVIDRTGLTGRYDFVLEFSRNETGGMRSGGGYNEPPPLPSPPPGSDAGVSIFTAVRELGLKLDAQKFPLDVVVVDRAEKTPKEN